MAVTGIDKDLDRLTLTLTADFTAPVERVWQLWADPRQLESWWGPPGFPASVQKHDLVTGGEVTYVMTGPEGEKYHGWWRVTAVEAPTALDFTDGFADEDGEPSADMPITTVRARLTGHEGGTRMELSSVFESREEMQQLLDMGVADGLAQAVGQMDDLLSG